MHFLPNYHVLILRFSTVFDLDAEIIDENIRSRRSFDIEHEGFHGPKLTSSFPDFCSRKPPSPTLLEQKRAIQELEDEIHSIPTRIPASARQLQVDEAKDNILQDCNEQKSRRLRRAPVNQLVLVPDRALPLSGRLSSRKSTCSRCSVYYIARPRFI